MVLILILQFLNGCWISLSKNYCSDWSYSTCNCDWW